jgi:hypothetical protein
MKFKELAGSNWLAVELLSNPAEIHSPPDRQAG